MLMAKSRRREPENLRRYFKPSPDAIAEVTSLLAPDDAHDAAAAYNRASRPDDPDPPTGTTEPWS
jgi:hypothetical protein